MLNIWPLLPFPSSHPQAERFPLMSRALKVLFFYDKWKLKSFSGLVALLFSLKVRWLCCWLRKGLRFVRNSVNLCLLVVSNIVLFVCLSAKSEKVDLNGHNWWKKQHQKSVHIHILMNIVYQSESLGFLGFDPSTSYWVSPSKVLKPLCDAFTGVWMCILKRKCTVGLVLECCEWMAVACCRKGSEWSKELKQA